MKAILAENGAIVVEFVEQACGMPARMKGLLGRRELKPGRAMLLSPCNSIHTFFMCFSLDVLFLDGENNIIKVVRNLKPWQMAFGGPYARSVLEMSAGWLPNITGMKDKKLIIA